MRFQFLLSTVLYITSSWALHESEAGVVDWHKSLIGIPQVGSLSTAPVFHRVGNENLTRSVILTATSSNVLAALNPVDGSVAWRHVFEPNYPITVFQKDTNIVAALSGAGGAMLQSFDVLTGHLLLEKRLHSPESGHLSEPSDLGTAITFLREENSKDPNEILILTNGHTLRKMDAATGDLKWSWSSPDQASLIIYSKIVATSSTTYLIGMAKSIKSYTLHVTALSTLTGEVLSNSNIPSSIDNSLSDFLAISNGGQSDLVWLEKGTVRFIPLTPELNTKATYYLKSETYKQIIDVGLSSHGLFVALKTDGSSRVVKLEPEGTSVKVIWDFAESATSTKYSESRYTGGFDKDGWPYIVRVYWSHVFKSAAAHVFSAHLADGRGLLTGFTFPFNTSVHGIIKHVAIDAANPAEYQVLARLFLTTTTGAVQLWQQDEHHWTREESLASISVAEFVELPERNVTASHARDDETFASRVSRQLSDAQNFPQYLVNFAKRFATGSYASVSSAAVPAADADSLSRDAFGFRQIIVAATPFGKVFGIDSSNGNVLWSRVFGLGWAAEIGGKVLPVKLYVTRTVNDGDTPQVVLVTQRRASNTLVDTVLFHIDALTGDDALGVSPAEGVLQGLDIISGPLVEAYQLQNSHRTIILLDEFLQVHLYPETPESKDAFSQASSSLHFPLRTGQPGHRQLMGHHVTLNTSISRRYVAHPMWTVALPAGEDIVSIVSPARGPVASIGKVLGNRTTLYKYLNPHLAAVLTSAPVTSPPTCAISVLDIVKGSIIYRVSLPSRSGVCDIKVALAENWLVYHYFDDDFAGVGTTKGYRMVSVELYEGLVADDKTKSSDISSYSKGSIGLIAHEQSYVFPYDITALSITTTKFGVTTKDVLVSTQNNKIQIIPHRFLDPRRPKRKPTTEELEEFLLQYDPLLPDDPRRTLSHNYQVSGVRRIVTTPALLESTSLVFAHGLDLFLTRVAPSGTFDVLSENFNKTQLVLTVLGLAVAIMVTKPMVRRKRLRERWYQ